MLVLTRKPTQKIRIADNITLTIVRVQDGEVKIGIDAPREIPVMRQEIFDRQQNAKRISARKQDH
jgi:carbon storage regulator